MQLVGSSYEGQFTVDGKRFHGFGQYTFRNGNRYVGGLFEGMFHGDGVIFFRRAARGRRAGGLAQPRADATPHEAAVTGEAEEKQGEEGGWEGLYRGVWEHGRHVCGRYVFGDGLVYGGEGGAGPPPTPAWAYCEGQDRRLWEECLGGLAPVQPYESVLGGVGETARARSGRAGVSLFAPAPPSPSPSRGEGGDRAAQERRSEEIARLWLAMPVVDSCTGGVAKTAPAFAEGQPRTGKEAERLMSTPEGIEKMQELLKIPTLAFGQGM